MLPTKPRCVHPTYRYPRQPTPAPRDLPAPPPGHCCVARLCGAARPELVRAALQPAAAGQGHVQRVHPGEPALHPSHPLCLLCRETGLAGEGATGRSLGTGKRMFTSNAHWERGLCKERERLRRAACPTGRHLLAPSGSGVPGQLWVAPELAHLTHGPTRVSPDPGPPRPSPTAPHAPDRRTPRPTRLCPAPRTG